MTDQDNVGSAAETADPHHHPQKEGRVSLVGAGPGDPGLITVRGKETLAAADVIIYDRLANPALLGHARPESEQIYVGKQPGDRTWRQGRINALLIERAQAGQFVCRLKGGDPFVFGRGGEEAVALAEAGVPFEVVPGVSSAIAAPAYAGIPVTYRGIGSAIGIIAGRCDRSSPEPHTALEAERPLVTTSLATGPDTLIFLMGVENLGEIVAALIAGGRSPGTPVALIRWGTWNCQETVTGTLADIVGLVRDAGLQSPAVTVVGEVVRLREKIRWFDNRPLFGRRVLVTRARDQASTFSERLAALGAEPVELPLIRIEPLPVDVERDLAGPYDWVVFASANAVTSLWQALESARHDWRSLGAARIGAVGPVTAQALVEHHLRPDFIPTTYDAAQLLAQFPAELPGKRVLLPRAADAPPALPEGLRAAGAKVQLLPIYRNVIDGPESDTIRPQFEAGELDAVTFTSSSTVRNFHQMFSSVDLTHVPVVCIGPATGATARELGIPVRAVASPHTIEGMADALVALFSR